MKKALFPLIILLAAAFVIAGCADPVTEVTVHNPGIDGIDADTITATTYPGTVLLKWSPASEAVSYAVIRQEVNADGEAIEGTIRSLGGASISPKGTPYATDTTVVDGKKYQYGVIAYGYTGAQNFTPESGVEWLPADKAVSAPNKLTSASAVSSLPTTPTYSLVKINSNLSSSPDYYETIEIYLTGLTPGWTYQVHGQETITSNPTWSSIGSSYIGPANFNWDNFVDGTPVKVADYTDTSNNWSDAAFQARLIVQYSPNTGYIPYDNAATYTWYSTSRSNRDSAVLDGVINNATVKAK